MSRRRATLPNLSALGVDPPVEEVFVNILSEILSKLIKANDGIHICSWVKNARQAVDTAPTNKLFNEAVKTLGSDVEAQAIVILYSVGISVPLDKSDKPIVPWGYQTFYDCAVDVCTTLSNLTFLDPSMTEQFVNVVKPFNMQASNEDRTPFTESQQLKQATNYCARWTDSLEISHCLWVHASYGPICAWDVSNVTNLDYLFYVDIHSCPEDQKKLALELNEFNQSLNRWDVSNVTSMRFVFLKVALFNRPLDKWDVCNVTDMEGMFCLAKTFDQPLDAWGRKLKNVTNMDSLFFMASSFNQPLDTWDVSNVTNMNNMFYGATKFNQNLDKWNVQSVERMDSMFQGATSFKKSTLEEWNVGKVRSMKYMFDGAKVFNGNISEWNVGNVNSMICMFRGASSFNGALEEWNVETVIEMRSMFENATSFDQPLNKWDVKNVQSMQSMFHGAKSYKQNFKGWILEDLVDFEDFSTYSGISAKDFESFKKAAEKKKTG